ncbi:unnamed protein product [Cuscuta campestris]|uniref:Uncharacterized protein n=1 Tax=Cuscuta campestris TaxID=132261 RepID=A0A484MHB2_9ASTE|nr:unnamed protein product [Cuscuta campestris]
MKDGTKICAEKDGISENQEKDQQIAVKEERGNMDLDEANEGDDDESRGHEGEDFTQIFTPKVLKKLIRCCSKERAGATSKSPKSDTASRVSTNGMDAPSSSPFCTEKTAINDGVACSTLIAMNVDGANKGEDDEARGLEGEDFTQIFRVGDREVWETKNFSKWSKLNWLCFSRDYDMDDSFFDISTEDFEPGEDPRSGRRFELKMGHSLLDYPLDAPWAYWYFKEASEGAKVAIA